MIGRRNAALLAILATTGCPDPGPGQGETETESTGTSTTPADSSTSASTVAETGTTADASTGVDGGSTDTDGSGSSSGEPQCPDEAPAGLTMEQSYGSVEYGWELVERWSSDNPGFIQEQFFPDSRSEQTSQRLEFFDFDPTPHSSVMLMYYAPGWEDAAASGRTPVLLAHGANDNADRAWSDPGESGDFGCGTQMCPNEGLMQALVDAGYPVFAVSMPHSQGDNYYWSEQLSNAIRIIQQRTCASQVDLIGWSKGAFAARMYASSVTEDWGTAYADDVRKLVLIGGPNLGFDYLFRYGTAHNLGVWPPAGNIHAPVPHETQLVGGVPVDLSEYAIWETAAGDYFRGQRQMVAMWIDEYPLTFLADNGLGLGNYATVDTLSTYWGEDQYTGLFAQGRGIEFTINQGSLVEPIVDAGIPASVQTYLLCSEITSMDAYIPGIPNEIAGPSDGVVFVDSCAAADGIGNLVEAEVLLDVNHLQLGWEDSAVETVLGWLSS